MGSMPDTSPSPTPTGTQEGKPVGLLLHSVLKLLHAELRPLSVADIQKLIDVDLAANPDLRENVKSNPKVISLPDGRFRWKSKYYLRDRTDLLALLSRARAPVVASELYDSYKLVKDDIEELSRASPRQLISIKVPSTGKTMLFSYDPRLYVGVSQDIVTKFHEISLPDPSDMHRFLMEHGLKKGSQLVRPYVSTVMRKRPRKQEAKKTKRVKLTNVHMEGSGIDLPQDVDLGGGKPSAFKE